MLGLGLGIWDVAMQRSGPATFTPASLTPAIWFDPSDLATLFTDTAGTTPVTADGDVVKRMNNKGSLGGSMQEATNPPLYKTSGGLSWLQFDGVNDRLISAATMNLSAAGHLGFAIAVMPNAAGSMFPLQLGNGASGCFEVRMNETGVGSPGIYIYTTGTDAQKTTTTSWGSGVKSVITIQDFDITVEPVATKMPFRINAASPAKTVATDAGTAGTVFANASLYLGYTPTFAAFASINIYGVIITPTPFSAGGLANVETWLGAKGGLTL